MLAAILVIGSGVSLGFFMNSLWDDSKVLNYVNLDSDSDTGQNINDYSHHTVHATYPL